MNKLRLVAPLLCLLILTACAANTGRKQTQKKPVNLPGILNAAELHDLFVGKTVESVTVNKNRQSISYYDPNGQVRQVREGTRRNGFWRISKKGRICLQMEDRNESCRAVARQAGAYLKFVIKNDGNHRPVVRYPRFRNGNPLNL